VAKKDILSTKMTQNKFFLYLIDMYKVLICFTKYILRLKEIIKLQNKYILCQKKIT